MTLYSGPSQFYFRGLLRKVVQVGELDKPGLKILDFGCGRGELKKLLPEGQVVGYDVRPEWSDVPDWRPVPFEVMVANQVFYSFEEKDLQALLTELEKRTPRPRLVVGISRRGWLNKAGMFLLGRRTAHSAARLSPSRELTILQDHCRILESQGVWGLADVHSLEFK